MWPTYVDLVFKLERMLTRLHHSQGNHRLNQSIDSIGKQILSIDCYHSLCVWGREHVFTGWKPRTSQSKQARWCLHEVKERPGNSPVSQHVLVRPGISAHGSELCSSFPLSGSQRHHHTTPTWITVNSEASTPHRGRWDESRRSQLYQHRCEHAKVPPQRKERTAAGPKLNTPISVGTLFITGEQRGRSRWLHYGFVASGVALCVCGVTAAGWTITMAEGERNRSVPPLEHQRDPAPSLYPLSVMTKVLH